MNRRSGDRRGERERKGEGDSGRGRGESEGGRYWEVAVDVGWKKRGVGEMDVTEVQRDVWG